MKLTNTHSMKAKSGMTLLELTVVILVLLSLISILFVGARAWKRGSDRSANIMNLRNTQQAMRGHQNTREIAVGTANSFTQTILEDYMKFPKNIGLGTDVDGVGYTAGTAVTATGTLWLQTTALGDPGTVVAPTTYGPLVTDIDGW
jgi:prepilin-type N-terminal cleavage/methylation domain-containing protein